METLAPPRTRMDARIKRLWVQALRSGKYRQGRNMLHSKPSHLAEQFCCLGVLCDLAVQEGVPLKVGGSELGTVYYNGNPKSLPIEVQKWAGLTGRHNPVLPAEAETPKGTKSLASENDLGATFNEIADLIEEYL